MTTPNKSNADQSGALAVVEKVQRLSAEREKLKERWLANNAAWADAVAAGRLFGVEVGLPGDLDSSTPSGLRHHRPRLDQANLFEASGEQTIREAVLDHLRAAGEKGIKAATVRRSVESMMGRQLHYKTIGMTLYRLSEKGFAKRIGLIWYPTAKAAETKTPAS